jgi:hypothetical protein
MAVAICEYVETGQEAQASAAQGLVANLPAAHPRQALAPVEAENSPLRQAVHFPFISSAELYLPATHFLHSVPSTAAHSPAWHFLYDFTWLKYFLYTAKPALMLTGLSEGVPMK